MGKNAPKRYPKIERRIELGLEVAETLLIKGEPLSDELIKRYTNNGDTELTQRLFQCVDLLERCTLPMPRDIMAQVCNCSYKNILRHNNEVMAKLTKIANDELEKLES